MAFAPHALAKESSTALSDAKIKTLLIQQSINGYPGNCPCPYNAARNGSNCGGRSAYSRGGGYAPLCYPKDVTNARVAEYRAGAQ
ncbi:hypothetical protein D0A40_18265 [Xanthomonas campestris pv. raphani]|nr:hypothetical protein D0A40_18265 [Xanthomonas campestris pv. raphani]